jgi:hypothetical protein
MPERGYLRRGRLVLIARELHSKPFGLLCSFKLWEFSAAVNQVVLRLRNNPSRPAPVSRSVQGSGTGSPSSEKEALNGP